MAIDRDLERDVFTFRVEIAAPLLRDGDRWEIAQAIRDTFMADADIAMGPPGALRRRAGLPHPGAHPRWEPVPDAPAAQLNEDDINRLRERIRNAPIAPPMELRFAQRRYVFAEPRPVAEFVPPPNTPDELLTGAKYDPWKLENQLEEAAMQAHEQDPVWAVPGARPEPGEAEAALGGQRAAAEPF